MDDTNNVQIGDVIVTKKDIERAIRSLAYRKAYNLRPDVQAKRKDYNRKKALVMKVATRMMREKGGVE